MIKYLGSKRRLVSRLVALVDGCGPQRTVLDLFSGTSRVGHALKAAGHRVLANDSAAYAATLARCYVAADAEDVLAESTRLVAELNRLPGRPGYVTEVFCERARFFRPENGARIDAIRDAIAAKGLSPELEAVLLTSLLEAADRVDSTVGVQMAYLKTCAPRAHRPLELRVPDVLPRAAAGKGVARHGDAHAAAVAWEADVAYLDPPYNQHKYAGNYHVWETLVRWDAPATYGVAQKRVDVRDATSAFNGRRTIGPALSDLVDAVRAPRLIVSYSDEGFLTPAEVHRILARRGHVAVVPVPQRRYVGATLGVYDPAGRRVGEPTHLHHHELVFVVTPDPLPADVAGPAGVVDPTVIGVAT